MSVLVEPRDAALNEALRALRVAALRHKAGAERAQDPSLRDRLSVLARRRDTAAAELEARWPERPELSALPDADAEYLQDVLARVMAVLAASPDRGIAADSLACEEELERCLAAALGHAMAEGPAATLRAAREEGAAARAALGALATA